jgi:hypothetical protein
MRGAHLWAAAIVLACGSTDDDAGEKNEAGTVASCKQQFSPAAGYGWEDDLTLPTSPPPGSDAGAPPPATSALDSAVAECQSAGQPSSACDAALVMTHHAAICVAETLGLVVGVEPHRAGISFHPDEQRIVWSVLSVEYSEPGGGEGGDSIRIDAITGAELERGHWGATP